MKIPDRGKPPRVKIIRRRICTVSILRCPVGDDQPSGLGAMTARGSDAGFVEYPDLGCAAKSRDINPRFARWQHRARSPPAAESRGSAATGS